MIAWVLNLGFAGGTAAVVITPTHEATGIVWTYAALDGSPDADGELEGITNTGAGMPGELKD